MDDAEIAVLLKRLSRPHVSGGVVVERAAILASGGDSAAIMDWIFAHDGAPEATPPAAARGGLHGARASLTPVRGPSRFVLPADALG
jgi:hypothetical protein